MRNATRAARAPQPARVSANVSRAPVFSFSGRLLLLALGLTTALGCHSSVAVLELEKGTPAAERGQLVEDVGIETLGGVFTPLLPRGQKLPCEITETFSTAADNQERVEVRLFRGSAKLARDATLIGRFVIEGLPKLPRGTVNVAVTFSVTSAGSVVVSAREESGHAVRLRRSDDY